MLEFVTHRFVGGPKDAEDIQSLAESVQAVKGFFHSEKRRFMGEHATIPVLFADIYVLQDYEPKRLIYTYVYEGVKQFDMTKPYPNLGV